MQDPKAQAACLDTLEASINSILLNIGSAFNDHIDADSDRLAQTKRRLQANIPSAIDSYHGALDALEADIMRAKILISRDLAMMQAASKAPATPPKTAESSAQGATNGEVSQLDQSAFELINDGDLTMSDTPVKDGTGPSPNQPTQASTKTPVATAVKMEKTESRSSAAAGGQAKADVKPTSDRDDGKKPTATAPDEQGNNALGIQVQVDSKPDATNITTGPTDAKTSPPKDQVEQASDNGFNELLPGLYDAAGAMDMDPLNDSAFSNNFADAGGDAHMADFEAGLFGEGDDSANSFPDMLNLDSTAGQGQNDETQGAMDLFDDDFFNL